MADIKFKKNKIKRYISILIALVVALIFLSFPSPYSTIFTSKGYLEARVIYNKPSMYGRITVFDYADHIRAMLIDGIMSCTYNFGNKISATYSHEIAQFLKNYQEDKKNKREMLIIGLGCGGLLKELSGHNFNIDIVEINPNLKMVAKNLFGLPKNLIYKITTDDGFHFLRNTDKKYDIIVVDLCNISENDAHLFTQEFYKLVKSRLKDRESVFVQSLNIYRQGDSHCIDDRVANSILMHFPYLYISPRTIGEKDFSVINFFATQKKIEKKSSPSLILWKGKPGRGVVNQGNALRVARWDLPVGNALRYQVIRNFGFNILLGQKNNNQ